MRDIDPQRVAGLLETLWGGPETLIVISSDLSHYLPYDVARAIDEETARAVVALGPNRIDDERACGHTGLRALLSVARAHGLSAEPIGLCSSGDAEAKISQ